MPMVYLNNRYGYGRPRRYYGPGLVDAPEGLVRALNLTVLPMEVPSTEPPPDPIFEFPALSAAGYDVERARAASDDELLDVPGIGPATLKKIREALAE